jgi:hypothetical protein
VILQLPSISNSGATTASGYLILGIGTQTDNTPPSRVTVFPADARGYFQTTYAGKNLTTSFIDSGSNGNFFTDSSITQCSSSGVGSGFYCPTTGLNLWAIPMGANSNSPNESVAFGVINGDAA